MIFEKSLKSGLLSLPLDLFHLLFLMMKKNVPSGAL